MALIHMDNFSLLDIARTGPQMDASNLRLKYKVRGTPDRPTLPSVYVRTQSGRNMLRVAVPGTSGPHLVPAWSISQEIPNEPGRYVCGIRYVNVGTAENGSLGLVSRISDTRLGVILSFCRTVSDSKFLMAYRGEDGTAKSASLPYNSGGFYLDFLFDKVSDDNEYSLLMVSIDNNVVFAGNAFCNYGSNLEFVFASPVPFAETVGSPFLAEYEIGDSIDAGGTVYFTDMYVSNEGTRFGNPTIVNPELVSVTSDMQSDLGIDYFAGVPDLNTWAQGEGATTPVYEPLNGSVAQFSALVQSNDGNAIDAEVQQGAIREQQVNSPAYVSAVGPVSGASNLILSR